jgi:hypothetical protein
MLSILAAGFNTKSASGQARRNSLLWFAWFLILTGLAGFTGLILLYMGPNPALIGWFLYVFGAAAILYRPRYGVYLILFLALLGDSLVIPWYPFVKNFSSVESIFYLNGSLIISPMEVYIGLTFGSWLVRAAMQRKFKFHLGSLLWPVLIYLAFIVFGMGYGVSRGGILNIGLWEARPIFYLPSMLFLVSNLITKREHVSHLMWAIMVALFIEGIIGDLHFLFKLNGNFDAVNSLTEHATAVHFNTLFVFLLATWLYKASPAKRFILPWMVPVVGLAYFAAQRRAAFLTLAIALGLMAIILFTENRRVFWLIVLPGSFLFMLYLAVFWNRSGVLGMPASAIKSVVSENQASQEDQLSNLYRVLENVNSSFTIHTSPLTGVGFGNKFFIIVPMADISSFIWWEYITHNSIIWIWMKTGVGGFISMIFLVGMSIMTGVRALWRMPGRDLSAAALTAILYLVMHFTYAYVDMSWDTRSMLYVGSMMGLINALEHIVAQPVPLPRKRWPWQPDPKPAPSLKPVVPVKTG